MPHTLSRYTLSRWLTPFLGALLFYGGLLVASELVTISREIFSQGAPLRWLFPILATSLPDNLGMILPMAAVLGGLMGTQALANGSELVAFQGLGVGSSTIIKPWAIMAMLLVSLAGLNANVFAPAMNRYQAELKQRMTEEAKANLLKPGGQPRVLPASPNHALWVAPEGAVHVMEVGPQGVQHLTAEKFEWGLESLNGDPSAIRLYLRDLKGCIYVPGDRSVVHLNQASQDLRFPLPPSQHVFQPTPLRFLPTGSLIALGTPIAKIEIARRLALPLSTAALFLLGIALGIGHPRFQRGGAILKSLGVILLYYFLLQMLENKLKTGALAAFPMLLGLPLAFLGLGWGLLHRRLAPHRSSTRAGRAWIKTKRSISTIMHRFQGRVGDVDPFRGPSKPLQRCRAVLSQWSQALWWRNWGATLGSLLILNLLIEYVSLAGDLAQNPGHGATFVAYWLWNLPPFLGVALPVAFLLGSVMAMSQAAISQEWNALKSGGVSLWQWIWASKAAWGSVLVATLLLQAWVAPIAIRRSDNLYQEILKRPSRSSETPPWMNLGHTGVLWYLDRNVRWGFPLKPPGEAPILLRWERGRKESEALPWGGLSFVLGPPSHRLFPDRALQDSAFAEETPTLDLFHWQRWAPDPARAALLWARLLGWLAGPCLVIALLSFAFPAPRVGRGQALGMALVGGLVFLGFQILFAGAARAGEVPAPWGVLAPLILLLGFGLWRLPRVRT